MATVTYIRESKQSISAMKGVIDYCCQDKKVYDETSNLRLVSGVNCDGKNAFSEFLATKKLYKKTDGMNFYQYVQSFSPEENITPQQAHEVALEFAEKAWQGYEVLVATHCDAQHIHSHFVINSVGFENGKKLRQNPNTLKSLRALSDEICRQYNLSTLEPYSKDGIKISTREYRTAVKGQSWKFKLMNDIDKAMNISGSKEDFIKAMLIMGYSVIWTDDRKYITYQCPNKMKCRDIKLHNEKYLKGSMENEFRYRQKQYFRQPQAEEQQFTDGDRATIGRNESDFDSVTGQRGRTQSVENGYNLSAGAVQPDFKNLNGRPDGGVSGENSGNQQRQYGVNLKELSGGAKESFGTDFERNQVGANADDRINPTGWEESRRIFEQYLAKRSGTRISNSVTSEKVNSVDNLKMDSNNNTVLGSINSLAESLSRIIEDEEERRKRIEAEQNGSDIGTLLGLAIGVFAEAISKEDNNYDEELDNIPTIQM
ncbi:MULTISPECIES: relaxase/mobilization nuclease domain-containing protein [unclassified Ruminococcus]|uniref:relaxase/mobilization nuclease domain-containing protein n=1 Tax=unclassified Ruminococcus TaxID=2608920 RepID=UPI00210E10A2|nr:MULTISPECIES: relaxase/mobilization nuclease domain-containing protein [unclassified Ruminococcus]MCQ4021774.1 relaxase/mobilization nuclease domain-containing protein [Ruminococcus sp. zg-924]MCQ4114218.1 relaxase/mobilization nuclease domain-containing protein [Ruminococcus sp. zg-921]